MTGISEYSVIIGRNHRTVEEIASFCDSDMHKQMHEIGLAVVPTDNERPLSDMIFQACSKIRQRPDLILIAHSLPFIRRTGNDCNLFNGEIPVYYISGLPCVIMHKSVEIACKMLQNHLYDSILVIGADKAYSDRERVFFGTVMGDAVIALLLKEDTDSHHILSSQIATTVIAADGENSDDEDIFKFRSMNANLMKNAIMNCLKKADLTDVDRFVTHTSNRKFWDTMSILIKCPRTKFWDDNIVQTGHMNSHDSFIHYFYYYEQGCIHCGETSMLINPGFGGSQGCTLIKT